MNGKRLIYLLALATLSQAIEKSKSIQDNDHLRIINPGSDDSELMRIEASGSKNLNRNKTEQENVKTLSQQVADGKYGLIQKDLFSKPPKRPGILSYELNSEVPNDTIKNLGGLDKNEIWLAENHLLVLKGGTFPPYEDRKEHTESLWPPLDTYKASLHQVKIPPNPKVPPPFPVQLSEDGPLQILGTNFSRTLNETDKTTSYSISSSEEFPKGQKISTIYPNSPNSPPGTASLPVPIVNSGEFPEGVSFPPTNLNETWPPFLGYLPPGAVILPPPGNQTDLYDDDDPSIYYPPPYSFFYPKDNSSIVPPGPLVPGIILPPPPNFFALLEDTTTSTVNPIKNVVSSRYRKPTTVMPNKQIYPTTTPIPATINANTKLPEKPFIVYPVKDEYVSNEKRPTKITTEKPKIFNIMVPQNRTYLPAKTNKPHFIRKNPQNITILRPVKAKTSPPPKIYLPNVISQKPLETLLNKNPVVSTTQVPLKYYTTSNNIDAYSGSLENDKNKYNKVTKTTPKAAQYYYYDEEPGSKFVTTPKIPKQNNNYYHTNEEFYIPPKPNSPVRQRKPQYIYVTARPYNTQKPRFRFIQQPVNPDTFSIHIAKLQNQIRQYYTTIRPTRGPRPKPVYQYSFQAANYRPRDEFKPSAPTDNHQNEFKPVPFVPPKYSVEIQQAIEIFPTEAPKYNPEPIYYENEYRQSTKRPGSFYATPKPNYQYEVLTQKAHYHQPITTARPILQYSFEVTQNPVYDGFYTKPDEGLFDENTREYFTVFGKKLPAPSTPLPTFAQPVTESFSSPSEQSSIYQEGSKFQNKPISLESDTRVNYVNPRPNVNPEAESVPSRNSNIDKNYPNVVKYPARPAQYNRPQRIKEKEPEIIKAIELPVRAKEGQEGSYISYELPGDNGAHFYFLTPQLAQRREQGSGFYYSQTNSKRIRRDEIKSDKER